MGCTANEKVGSMLSGHKKDLCAYAGELVARHNNVVATERAAHSNSNVEVHARKRLVRPGSFHGRQGAVIIPIAFELALDANSQFQQLNGVGKGVLEAVNHGGGGRRGRGRGGQASTLRRLLEEN